MLVELIVIVVISYSFLALHIQDNLTLESKHVNGLDTHLALSLMGHVQSGGIYAVQRVAVVIHVLTIILPGAAESIAVIIRVDAPIFYQRERVLSITCCNFSLSLSSSGILSGESST